MSATVLVAHCSASWESAHGARSLPPITTVTRPTFLPRNASAAASSWVLPPAPGLHAGLAARSADVAALQARLSSLSPDRLATICAKLSPVPPGANPVAYESPIDTYTCSAGAVLDGGVLGGVGAGAGEVHPASAVSNTMTSANLGTTAPSHRKFM